ncbi:hypothetical protein [Halobacillus sp. Marseille-P3879]|uniref:hypothetical protein n=1 Tax=Halobacillus TaxID=45667 RepID=UPI00190F0053|nr:hypothetical protein [Halobacillus sp. Marseille-P3879]
MKEKKQIAYEGKEKFELDVDRMINEGMGGGRPQSAYGREQFGEVHPIPAQNKKEGQ